MRLYGAITKVEPQDDGTIKVHGIASSEAVDDQGEIVRATAMRAAIPEYMRFPALREMHQLSAAGTTLEAEVGDDGITRIVAHVVDAAAVSKVKHKVYRGFSIGGRVTKRDSTNPKDILGVTLNEISLVDRPANPEAVFDVWKAVAAMSDPFNPPMQVWTCPYPDHKHTSKSTAAKCVDQYNTQVATKAATGADAAQAEVDQALAAVDNPQLPPPAPATPAAPVAKADDKPYGDVSYADPGYQSDGKKRYPIDTERHVRAALSYINHAGNASKYSSEQLAHIKAKIHAAAKRFGIEVSDKAAFNEWLRDLLADAFSVAPGDDDSLALAATVLSGLPEAVRKTHPNSAEALVTDINKLGRRHNADDQALLDAAGFAIHRAVGIPGERAKISHMVDAHKAVLDAGACNVGAEGREMISGDMVPSGDSGETEHATTDTGNNPSGAAPNPTGAVPASPHPGEAQMGNQKALTIEDLRKTSGADLLAYVEAIMKRGGGPNALCQAAHDMICAASDGGTCKDGMPKPARHNAMDWGHMHKAHGYLMNAAAVKCNMAAKASQPAEAVAGEEVAKSEAPKPIDTDKLAKTVIDSLAAALGPVLARLDTMDTRIKQIADTPQAATAMAIVPDNLQRTTQTAEVDANVVAKQLQELNRRDPEAATKAMIKAAYARPLVIHGFTDAPQAVPQRRIVPVETQT